MKVSNYSPPQADIKTKVYNKFKGVDFSTDPALVNDSRSPYAPNLVSDLGGMPEKRLGWRTILTFLDVDDEPLPINGLYYGLINGTNYYLVHAGTNIYSVTETAGVWSKTLKYSTAANAKSTGFYMNDSLYILDGTNYLSFDGTTVAPVVGYIPRTIIGRHPAGETVGDPKGGGTAYQPFNLLTGTRMEGFIGDASSLDYFVSAQSIDSVDKVEYMDSGGDWVTATITTDYTVDLTAGKVSFTAAKDPPVANTENVRITYTKTTTGNADRIKKCTVCTMFGVNATDVVFVTGNPDYPAYDWWSEQLDPTYFPDNSYAIVGTDNTKIMGYQKLGKYMIVIKEDSSQDTTIFQRYGDLDSDGNYYFPIEPGIAGTGAISKFSFDVLLDEPLFLSSQGVMAITSTNVLAERTIKNRSFFVDYVLTKENNLSDACAVVWNGLYIIAVNNVAFILDSRNRSYKTNQNTGDFVYECYYWTNIPARVFLRVGDELYFGTADGRLCKFNTDISLMTRFNDDDTAVTAIWTTKNDDDGASYLYKSMLKRGCSVTIKPFLRSSAKVYYAKDGNPEQFVRLSYMDIFDFDDFDFERFSFNTNDSPQDIYLKKKVKKYKRLQLIIKSDGLSEGFGVYQIAKTYSIGGFAKK